MSLINEALKRTRDASYQPEVVLPPPVAPDYQNQPPVESRSSKGILIATLVVALVAIAGVVVIGFRVATGIQKLKDGFASNASVVTAKATPTDHARSPVPAQVVKPATAEAPPPAQTPAVSTAPQTASAPAANSKTAEDELVGRLMEKIKAEQAAVAAKPPPAELPKLVLQGITSATDGNEAMINGVSLREGEDIEGARIVSIERRAVRLDFGGREIVLHLP